MKLPSAEVKPAIQSGSISVIFSTSGLLTGTTVGKAEEAVRRTLPVPFLIGSYRYRLKMSEASGA
jgi:hypothetical protein